VHLLADPVRLEQVLVNLLSNAAKYTRPGGAIALLVEEAGEVVIRVRDNGIGIPADVLPAVFDLFVQADHTLDRAQGGLGIGLTLAKKLVEMHGGTIGASSAGRDQGSEFTVRLPVLEREEEAAAAQGAASAGGGAGLRVLVVDDSEDLAQSLQLLLEVWGHKVWLAHDAPSAFGAYEACQPDVVLLDIGLPQVDGHEVARQLRQAEARARPLLVAMSGYCQEEDRRRAREAGFDLHMAKPVDPVQLEALLASVGARAQDAPAGGDQYR
jgi:CheY-like chemotaxis protein